jgi:hypothetical protein
MLHKCTERPNNRPIEPFFRSSGFQAQSTRKNFLTEPACVPQSSPRSEARGTGAAFPVTTPSLTVTQSRLVPRAAVGTRAAPPVSSSPGIAPLPPSPHCQPSPRRAPAPPRDHHTPAGTPPGPSTPPGPGPRQLASITPGPGRGKAQLPSRLTSWRAKPENSRGPDRRAKSELESEFRRPGRGRVGPCSVLSRPSPSHRVVSGGPTTPQVGPFPSRPWCACAGAQRRGPDRPGPEQRSFGRESSGLEATSPPAVSGPGQQRRHLRRRRARAEIAPKNFEGNSETPKLLSGSEKKNPGRGPAGGRVLASTPLAVTARRTRRHGRRQDPPGGWTAATRTGPGPSGGGGAAAAAGEVSGASAETAGRQLPGGGGGGCGGGGGDGRRGVGCGGGRLRSRRRRLGGRREAREAARWAGRWPAAAGTTEEEVTGAGAGGPGRGARC